MIYHVLIINFVCLYGSYLQLAIRAEELTEWNIAQFCLRIEHIDFFLFVRSVLWAEKFAAFDFVSRSLRCDIDIVIYVDIDVLNVFVIKAVNSQKRIISIVPLTVTVAIGKM